jgi:serine/threonine-protein kinase RsbW
METEEQTVDVKFSLVFPREALSLGVMRRVLGDTLGALGVTPDCIHDILVAVTEACTNVLLHGGPARGYEVDARVGESRCLLEVLEKGPRLDPRWNIRSAEGWRSAGHFPGLPRRTRGRTVGWLTGHVSRPRSTPAGHRAHHEQAPSEARSVARLPESGRGLQIMRALVDDVTLHGSPGRTSVSMQKQLTWRSDAPLPALSGSRLPEAG